MKIARVIGSTISTIKNRRIRIPNSCSAGKRMPMEKMNSEVPYAAIDLVDAGVGDLVLTCHGSAARQTPVTKETPTDAVIMAVLDHLEVDGEITFRK